MRTHGDDIAEVLALLGVRPVWQQESRRVRGIDVIPLSELGRPRIDVTLRISGFFRDAFPNLVHLVDEAIQTVAGLDEPPEQNFVRKHVIADRETYRAAGVSVKPRRSAACIAFSAPNPAPMAPASCRCSTSATGAVTRTSQRSTWPGVAMPIPGPRMARRPRTNFKTRFREIVVAVKNQDNREHDIFDSDDYLQYHGGMMATIRALTGREPESAISAIRRSRAAARVRDLGRRSRRVFRSRVVNPKWI